MRTYDFYTNLHNLENIFIGDSVIQGVYTQNFFPNLNYELIGVNGMRLDCQKYIHESIKKINPKNIIVYLGGNDADDQIYTPEISIKFYREMIEKFLQLKNIENIYLLELNLASKSRSFKYVTILNKGIKKISLIDNKIKFVQKPNLFDFQSKKSFECKKLTYDCEHIKADGYKKWFKYLQNEVPNLINE